jgi:transcriptional regulator with AAA-type ATPase domain
MISHSMRGAGGESLDTQPALDTKELGVLPGPAEGAGLGLCFVYPERRPLMVPGRGRPLVIGREVEGPAQLPGSELSRRHAELAWEGRELIARDLGSRNGVFVDGRRQNRAPLARGSVVRVGGWVAVVVAREDGDQAGDQDADQAGKQDGVPTDPNLDGDMDALAPGLHLGPAAQRLAVPARQLATTGISLVLEGEGGTGKDRFAAAIHVWSGRQGPLVVFNCAAVPQALVEAELFGYREGAFAGAHRASPGHFRAASGGTLFLDEVTDLPLAVQAKLLRALDRKEVLPVGESRAVPIDVRVVAATQMPLHRAVAEQKLRPDLHARLDGFTLTLPPLRERREDIPSLFLHLLARQGWPGARLSPRLVEALCIHRWPLNVRELDLLARRLVALHRGEPILRRSHLPDRIRLTGGTPVPAPAPATPWAAPTSAPPSRDDLVAALTRAGGNLARAAERLGITRSRAYRLLGEQTPAHEKRTTGDV